MLHRKLVEDGDSDGNPALIQCEIIVFEGERTPDREALERMHHLSHEECFIANSLKTAIRTEILP